MPARNKMIDKESENRFSSITWADIVQVISELNNNEQDLFIADIKFNDGSIRQILANRIKQSIKRNVGTEIDDYIATGSIPVAFIRKILD